MLTVCIEEPYVLVTALGIAGAVYVGAIGLLAWFGTYKGGTR